MTDKPHFTTRRGFIAAAGFGGTALYGLWVGYGAAPGPLAVFGAHHGETAGGHADPADAHLPKAETLTPEAFEARVRDFVSRFGEADGSVRPQDGDPSRKAQAEAATHGSHGGHGAHGEQVSEAHASEAAPDAHAHRAAAAPIDVWLQAGQFFFEPAHLRLEAGQPYRFRMMATDVSHGASIQFGAGGRLMRLRPNQLVETEITLQRPGEFLIYCTYYCGPAHDAMQARLSVTEGGAA